ncbi:helix-turn-helix domain-containing protein [Pseudonocardia sp.]|uniref:helix-turn-helix domain-containing protein n=1 Tax=Pseudonocardia sp. TaxID=60912 RepID=UPI002638D7CC|nr:helix-turn-helix domain-containing protein [Pseudonocardia sp.]
MTPAERERHGVLLLVDEPAAALERLLATVPPDAAAAQAELTALAGRLVGSAVTARPVGQEIELHWDPARPVPSATRSLLRRAGVWLTLAAARDEARDGAAAEAAETAVVRDVVERLLSVRDLDQVLLSIADRTAELLDADICGVFLREGDEVRMRSCVGNRVVETARLRMQRGQGVAGLVFLTGQPAKVDNYLDDRTISQDFVFLAVAEETQSALAVPLRLHGELVGVLEVWRRRPSLFTERDVRRMVTFADVASVAIDNARLHVEQATAVREMEQAGAALRRQVAVLDRSSRLQQTLLTTVRDGGGLPAIARTVGGELGCQVGIYDTQGVLVAAHGGRSLTADLPAAVPPGTRPGRTTVAGRELWTQPVHADGDRIGWVLLRPDGDSAEMMDVVAGQVAMACSLALLRQRAASRARSEVLEQVLWDLLQGPVEHRIAARARAQQQGVPLGGALRVLYGQLENVEELAAELGWDTSRTDRVRRAALRAVRGVDDGRALSLASLRGDFVVAVVSDPDRAAVKDLVVRMTAVVRDGAGALRLTWGISRAHDDVVELPSALNEARTALSAAHRLGGENVFLYEELGIVRLLLGSGDDPDLLTFIEEVTGPLLAYDRENDGSLIRTLRGFFDADCSQRVAAERLFIHHKTLRYRLERIKQLTGLDLSRHEDRMRADFALRLLQVSGSDDPGTGEGLDLIGRPGAARSG